MSTIKDNFVEEITDKFSTTVEYRMKKSALLDNNKGLPYIYKIDLNIRLFVENNDFLNSKIVLAITYYAPHSDTGTILHESVADVMIDNKDVFKIDNEYSYSGLGSCFKLDIYDKILGQESSRTEQIQFYIDFATLIKIVNAKTIEIRVNKKWNYGGILQESEIIKFIGLYNALFDPEFMKDELSNQIEIELAEKQKQEEEHEKINNNDQKILEFCKQGKKLEAVKFRKEISGSDLATSKKYVEELCDKNFIKVEPQSSTSSNCFVITATMGDPYHPIVDEFRAYRDSKLLTNFRGKVFVSFYYKVGPLAAFVISKSPILRKLSFRLFVNPVYQLIRNDRRKKQK